MLPQFNTSANVPVLIETYWNVNILKERYREKCRIVLIETYWNVNDISADTPGGTILVLIETYWNVNVYTNKEEMSRC